MSLSACILCGLRAIFKLNMVIALIKFVLEDFSLVYCFK